MCPVLGRDRIVRKCKLSKAMGLRNRDFYVESGVYIITSSLFICSISEITDLCLNNVHKVKLRGRTFTPLEGRILGRLWLFAVVNVTEHISLQKSIDPTSLLINVGICQ